MTILGIGSYTGSPSGRARVSIASARIDLETVTLSPGSRREHRLRECSMVAVRLARLLISVGVAASVLLASPTVPAVVAQDPAILPELGETVLTDQLTTAGTFVP